jgi:hypothetical protein
MIDTSEIATYRRLFDEKYEEIEQLLADLPATALLWKPFEQSPWQGPSNSLGLIIAHALSSTVYLLRRAEYIIGRLAWDQVDGDEGPEEFGPANHDPAYLRTRAHRTHAYVNRLLDSLAPADLDQSRTHPRRTERILVARYDVQHALEHLSQHIGHAQITRQLWALQATENVDPGTK